MGEVIPESTVRVLDHGFVRLDDAMASDLSVVNAARVSFARRKEAMDEADEGLIRFLMRDRHGCYDDASDVLTDAGWKPWPKITGGELFATLSRDGRLVYQPALRLVRKEHRGHMIGFKGEGIDLLVTPDHRVLVSRMTAREGRAGPGYALAPAHSVLWKSHRHVSVASWQGADPEELAFDGARFPAKPLLRLIGLFVGGGSVPAANRIVFDVPEERAAKLLDRTVCELGLDPERRGMRRAVGVGSELGELFAGCYDAGRKKVIPRRLLELGTPPLEALYEGLVRADGCRLGPRGRGEAHTFHATSRALADQLQELALKLGRSAVVLPHRPDPEREARWRVTVSTPRSSRPELCGTRAWAAEQMGVELYDGVIHCVEVPNRTLYVRRNGYPAFCGNTPFEHNAFRFHVRTPLFVAREWFRHRMSSFNEFSMRYARATDEFYVPEPEDVRTQVGKPGAYSFDPVTPELAERTREELRAVYEAAYATYERLVELGVARELARAAIPVGAYTEFFWTVNARSLMNFVSLRAAETAQREIRRYADACERFFAQRMPVTHAAFVENGRVAP